MEKIHIFFHVGLGKTGTSAIQAFLNYNRSGLMNRHSVLYPNMKGENFGAGRYHNHCNFILRNTKEHCLEELRRAIRYTGQRDIRKIVISCEGLFEDQKTVSIAGELSREVPVSMIVYLRRQDHYIEASWKQWGLKDSRYEDFADYARKFRTNWLATLQRWSAVVGKENLMVRVYEKDQLVGRDVVPDLLSVLGIDYESSRWVAPEKTNLNINPGFNRDIIEVLELNKGFYSDIHDHALFNFFSETQDAKWAKKPFEQYSLLSPAERLEVLGRSREMNTAIAREYLGREELFLEPAPDPDQAWEPYTFGLDTFVPVFFGLTYGAAKNLDGSLQRLRSGKRPGH